MKKLIEKTKNFIKTHGLGTENTACAAIIIKKIRRKQSLLRIYLYQFFVIGGPFSQKVFQKLFFY